MVTLIFFFLFLFFFETHYRTFCDFSKERSYHWEISLKLLIWASDLQRSQFWRNHSTAKTNLPKNGSRSTQSHITSISISLKDDNVLEFLKINTSKYLVWLFMNCYMASSIIPCLSISSYDHTGLSACWVMFYL